MKTAILALCASSASAFVNIPKLQSLKERKTQKSRESLAEEACGLLKKNVLKTRS